MDDKKRILTSMCFGAALLGSGCEEDPGGSDGTGGLDGINGDETVDDGGDADADADADAGDGDADAGDADAGDGDGDTGEPEECNPPTPYLAGGWDIGCCQDEIEPQNGWAPGGVHVGTIMPDHTYTDQFGEALRLYDFCHEAVYYEYVALW
jgi:cobalamin biosynthesis protein CobT